ncbi:MAG: GIY-YIG nuclease family protein, partial [Bacillota bacterium]|nr:GIY-YIG nuclease family protein [Bacillota bacterium]
MTPITHQFDNRLELVPQNPGVYLMKDVTGSVIYVGKAVSLSQRLRSYFTAKPQGNAKVLAMIARIADFETIICANELEALVLESTLIKKHQPQYNILLRDDRDYPYIRVTMNELYPRVLKAFRIGPDRNQGARYFGPYLAGDVYHALEALRSIFPLKTCRRVLPRDIGRERPCLNYHIGRCIGPCKGDVPVEDYRRVMERICRFFEGKTDHVLQDLKAEMVEASGRMAYEEAARTRDRILALERLMKKQQAVDNRPVDRDVLGLSSNGSEICLQKLEVRQGRLVASA